MPDLLVSKTTAMKPAEVMSRAVMYFAAQNWHVTAQDGYIATFAGMPRLHWMHTLTALLLTLCFIVPGVLYYFLKIRGSRHEQRININLQPRGERCEVEVTYPPGNNSLIVDFLANLV